MRRLRDRKKCSILEKLKTANVTVVQRVRQTVKRDEAQLGHIIQDLEDNVGDFDFDPKSIEKLLKSVKKKKSVKQANNMIKIYLFSKGFWLHYGKQKKLKDECKETILVIYCSLPKLCDLMQLFYFARIF